MNARDLFNNVVRTLESGKRNTRCKDLIKALKSLDFEVRDGSKQGHKVFIHDGLVGFCSASFTCGHGRNPEIKPAYVSKVLKVLRNYEIELIKYLEDK